MSKIGKINISIPEKVKVILNGNILNIEGPLGKKSLNLDLNMFDLNMVLVLTIQNQSSLMKRMRAYNYHGLNYI